MQCECRFTTHMGTLEFLDALEAVKDGGSFIYAKGDLMFSLDTCKNDCGSTDLRALNRLVWEKYDKREIHLTQRRLPHVGLSPKHVGGSYEYLATRRTSPGPHYMPRVI